VLAGWGRGDAIVFGWPNQILITKRALNVEFKADSLRILEPMRIVKKYLLQIALQKETNPHDWIAVSSPLEFKPHAI
jgi:hypothetical protein